MTDFELGFTIIAIFTVLIFAAGYGTGVLTWPWVGDKIAKIRGSK